MTSKLTPAQSAKRGRKYPDVVVRHNVRSQSARTGPLRGIVLHSTEGTSTLAELAGYFDRVEASSHVAANPAGQSSRMVPDSMKSWACAGYNSQTLNIEQVGFASQAVWPEAQLQEAARWIAYWSRKHGIPIQHGAVSNGDVTRPGVLCHSDLGVIGGGHHDPGVSYPFERVIHLARHYRDRQNKKGA